VSFEEDNKQFKELMGAIGSQKEVIENLIAGRSVSSTKQKAALQALDTAMNNLRTLMRDTALPAQEKQRRIAGLQAEIDRIELLRDFESNFEERMRLVRKLSRLNATLGTWESTDVFHFETLLDPEGQDFKTLLEEADRDIKARQNLQRVLKGIGVALSVGAFGAALAAKLAVAVV
jgi:hypothetical protein